MRPARPESIVVLVTGVAGCGKTTIGERLAETLGWAFRDADEFHPPANIAKMSRGDALTDEDRAPWLAAIRNYIAACLADGTFAVVTCSALKSRYRAEIVVDPMRVKVVFLDGSYETILTRLRARHGHFMKPEMLRSQFAALEPPEHALRLDVTASPDAIVGEIRSAFAL